jgi:hypothetical protein
VLLCFNEHSLYDFCNLKHYTCMVDLLGHAGREYDQGKAL